METPDIRQHMAQRKEITEAPNENEKEHGGNREKSLKERESNRRIGGSIGMAEED